MRFQIFQGVIFVKIFLFLEELVQKWSNFVSHFPSPDIKPQAKKILYWNWKFCFHNSKNSNALQLFTVSKLRTKVHNNNSTTSERDFNDLVHFFWASGSWVGERCGRGVCEGGAYNGTWTSAVISSDVPSSCCNIMALNGPQTQLIGGNKITWWKIVKYSGLVFDQVIAPNSLTNHYRRPHLKKMRKKTKWERRFSTCAKNRICAHLLWHGVIMYRTRWTRYRKINTIQDRRKNRSEFVCTENPFTIYRKKKPGKKPDF